MFDAELELFLRSRRSAGRSERTVDWYQQQLGVWLAWLDEQKADPLSADDLDLFILEERDKALSDATIHARYRSIRAFLNWMRKRKKIKCAFEDLPTSVIDAPKQAEKKPRTAAPADVRKIIDSILDITWCDLRDRCVLELLRATGVRVEEACEIQIADVDTVEMLLFVREGKGSKARVCPFDAAFVRAFLAYRFNRPVITSDRLFVSSDFHLQPVGELSTNAVRQMLRRRCADAAITYINPHSIRHMAAIKWLNDGVQLSAVSTILGHSSPSFTAKVYAKWLPEGLKREYNKVSVS